MDEVYKSYVQTLDNLVSFKLLHQINRGAMSSLPPLNVLYLKGNYNGKATARNILHNKP
jgi:hypothetical protein